MKYCVKCQYEKFNGAKHFCFHHSLSKDDAVTGPHVIPRLCEEMRADPTLCGKDGVLFSAFVPPTPTPSTRGEKFFDFFFFHPVFSILTGLALASVIIGTLITILK